MYGLTEAFRSTYLDPSEVDRRPDSIGKAIPDAEILVVRPDGSRCDPGEEGELVHRGALVALGYWNDPARTAERFKPAPGSQSDWRAPELAVWSGDGVVADEEGFLYFVGRSDEMIKTSGYRVSPTEVEEVAYSSGLVRDAVALGVPDPRLGQKIVLLATPVDGPELDPNGLITAMRRELPLYMVPSEVQVRVELPRGPQRQVRPQPAEAGGRRMTESTTRTAPSGSGSTRSAPWTASWPSVVCRCAGWRRGSARRRSSRTTAGCWRSGSRCSAPRCPRD